MHLSSRPLDLSSIQPAFRRQTGRQSLDRMNQRARPASFLRLSVRATICHISANCRLTIHPSTTLTNLYSLTVFVPVCPVRSVVVIATRISIPAAMTIVAVYTSARCCGWRLGGYALVQGEPVGLDNRHRQPPSRQSRRACGYNRLTLAATKHQILARHPSHLVCYQTAITHRCHAILSRAKTERNAQRAPLILVLLRSY